MPRPTKRLSVIVIIIMVMFELAPTVQVFAVQSAPAAKTSSKAAPKAAKPSSKAKATAPASVKAKTTPAQSAPAEPTATNAASVRSAPVKPAPSLVVQNLKVPSQAAPIQTDWSAMNWDSEVVLVSAYDEYQKKRDELLKAEKPGEFPGLAAELKGLASLSVKMSNDEALNYYQVPLPVRDLVIEYRKASDGKSGQERALKQEELRQKIKERWFSSGGKSDTKKEDRPKTDSRSMGSAALIDLKTVKPLTVKQAVPSSGSHMRDEGVSVKLNVPGTVDRHPLYRVSLPGLTESRQAAEAKSGLRPGRIGVSSVSLNEERQANTEKSWTASWLKQAAHYLLGLLRVEPVYAEDPTPLIAYYDGIEKNTMDYILYYLSQTQNADGSFGAYNQYELTGNIAILLSTFNRTDSGQFNLMLNYLKTATPQTNREKAMKARLMVGLGEPYQTLLDELAVEQNQKNGGWGLSFGYESDVLTTLEVVLAYAAANYGVADKLPAGLAYVLNQIGSDGAMYYTPGSQSSYYLMTETARDLLPFASYSVSDGTNQVSVQSKIDAILSYLTTHYDEATDILTNSSGVGDKLAVLDAMQTYSVAPAKQKALWKTNIGQQNNDGSFGNSLSDTIAALRAFPQTNLVITNVVANGSLVNYDPTSFTFTVKNTGYKASGQSFIYSFVDKFRLGDPIDCLAKGLSLAPGGVGTLTISYATDAFVGATNFLFYIEGESEFNYNDNWYETNLTFANASGKAAIPMYYIAQRYQSGGTPGLNVRWPVKSDSNRAYYVIGFRPQGSVEWSWIGVSNSWNGAFLTGGFTEGAIYEVTAGIINPDYSTITYFTKPTLVQVSGSDDKYYGGATGQVTVNNETGSEISTWGYGASGTSDAGGTVEYIKVPNGTTAAYVDENYLEELWTKFTVPVGATTTAVRLFSRLKPDTIPPTVSYAEIRYKYNYIVKNQKEVELFAYGTDDVAIKEADFYLWNPNEASWQYIGTTGVESENVAKPLPWYVPETLLGDGYKIKATFTDYQGNVSLAKEWGPFKIINGAPPVFNFTQPAGGEVWPLGTTQEIKWNSQSVNGVNTVSLYMISPTGQFLDGQSGLQNSGSYQWKFPKSAKYVGSGIKFRVYGEDIGNYEPGETYSAPFSLVDTSPQPGAPWSSVEMPFAFTTYNPAGGGVERLALAVGSDGSLHALYRYIQDQMGEPRYITEQLYYSVRSPAGVWSAPTLTYEKIWQTDGNLTGYSPIRELSLQLDSLNHPHVVWQDQPSGSCSEFNKQEIWYRTFDGASWSTPLNISANQTESWSPDFTLDSAGRAHVAWIDGRSWDATCQATGQRTIRYRVRDVNGVWSNEEQLNPDQYPADPRLAVTSDEVVHLTYNTSVPSGGYMTRGAGGWSAPSTIVSGLFPEWTDLAAGPTGKLHFFYRQYYQDPTTNNYRSRLMYMSKSGGGWSQGEEITPPVDGYYATYPALTVDANDQPHVVYELYVSTPTGSERNLMWTRRQVNGTWTTPSQANRVSQYVSDNTARAAFIPPREELAVSWMSEYNFAYQPHFNYADLNTAPAVSDLSAEPPVLVAGTPNLSLKAMTVDSGQNIAAAEYYNVSALGATSTVYSMGPADGVYDNKIEIVSALVDTTSWTTDKNPYTIFVRARDALGKWSEWKSLKVKVPTGNAMYGVGLGNWQLNELNWTGAKGEVRDDSGSNNHAVALGGAQTTTTAEVGLGRVAYFDGVDDAVQTPLSFENLGSLSVSAWYKMISAVPKRLTLVGGNNGGRFEVYVDNGRPGCRVWDTFERSFFTDEMYVGGWHQVVCSQTYGASPSTKLYVDGVLKKTVPYASVSVGGSWYIGKPGSTGAAYYQGQLDQVMMYASALSDSQVQEQYNWQKGVYGPVNETPASLVGYWRMDETTWDGVKGEVKDNSSFGNNATAVGGASTAALVTQPSGRVANLDGVNDYVMTPVSYSGQSAVSVSAWYATDNTSASNMALVGGNNGGRFEVYIHQGQPGCRVYDTRERSIYASEVNVGGWHHVVCVQKYGASPTTELYVDGVLKKSTPYASVSAGGAWSVGKPGSSGATYYKGLVDEVMILHTALTAGEIAGIYASQKSLFPSPSPMSDLIGQWKFNEPAWTGAIGEVKDSSGKANHATAYSGVNTTSSPEWLGVAGLFDGSDDNVRTPIPYGSADATVSAWYNSNNVIKSRMALVGGTNGGRFEVYVHLGRPACRIWNGVERTIYASSIPTLGAWHHVACVQTTGVSPSTKLYVDGVLVKSTPYSTVSAGGSWSVGRPGSTTATYFQGLIDQVSIFNNAQSGSQIADIYAAGR